MQRTKEAARDGCLKLCGASWNQLKVVVIGVQYYSTVLQNTVIQHVFFQTKMSPIIFSTKLQFFCQYISAAGLFHWSEVAW